MGRVCVVGQSGAQSAGGGQQRMCEKWRTAGRERETLRKGEKDSVSFCC